jgi:hypothetical protein
MNAINCRRTALRKETPCLSLKNSRFIAPLSGLDFQPDDGRRRKYGTRLFAVFGVARLHGAECRLAPVSGGPHAHERIAESRIADLRQHGAETVVVEG